LESAGKKRRRKETLGEIKKSEKEVIAGIFWSKIRLRRPTLRASF